MLRQLLTDIKAQLASVIQNGKIQVQGGASGGSGGGVSSINFEVTVDQSVSSQNLVVLGTIDASEISTLGIHIQNDGSYYLSAFTVEAKSNSNAQWISLFNEASDFTAPPFGSPLKGASGDLTLLPNNSQGWLNLDVSFYSQIRLQAASVDGTTLTVLAGGK